MSDSYPVKSKRAESANNNDDLDCVKDPVFSPITAKLPKMEETADEEVTE